MPTDRLIQAHCQSARIREGDYRPDIDGLRAVAVLAVVLYHAFPSLVPGGFVGVDVFFVISGYLISRHILEELRGGSFSVGTFYVRRVKRIFPALILVLVAATLFGWVVLTPGEYELLGRPIAGGAGFVANFVFWKEAGYFDMAADTKPLLHLWSLGIEEQFYIVWPFLLAWLWRRWAGNVGRIMAGLLLASLVYSIALVYRDATAAFYSPLARFWELGLGAAVAFGVVNGRFGMLAGRHARLAWAGAVLLAIAFVLIDSERHFPGAWVLLPAVGTACLILAGSGQRTWLGNAVLASRPLVWIGLISYPLYLWHWPLLSFARIMESATPPVEMRMALLGVSVALAWLTYTFVELPVRAVPVARARKLVLALGLVMLAIFVAGVAVRKLDGVKSRVLWKLNGDVNTLTIGKDRHALRKECGVPDERRKPLHYCYSSGDEPPRFAVLGDSKAEALYFGLAREAQPGMHGLLIGSTKLPKHDAPPGDPSQARNRLALGAIIDNPSVKVVVLANALRGTFKADKETGFVTPEAAAADAAGWLATYTQAIQSLEQAGKRVVFVIDNPTFPDPRSCISGGMTSSPFLNQFVRRKPNPRCDIRHTDHLEGTAPYRRFVADLAAANPSLTIYDPTPLLCDIAANRCSTTRDGKFLYSYSDHYSDYANSLIARDLLPVLAEIGR